MIEHKQNGQKHLITPLTEKSARFLNSFVGRTIIMDEKAYQSMRLEMHSHGCWIMGEK